MTPQARNLQIDALIFDVDGILIDVSQSYRQTIIQTVDLFFIEGLGLHRDGETEPLIDDRDIDLLKQVSGFNNDWDLTTAFIIYFLEMMPPQSILTYPLNKHVPAIMAYLQMIGSNIRVTIAQLRRHKNIARLARGLADLGGGLAGIDKLLKHRNRHLLPPGETMLDGNIIQRIFQEIYLGPTLFEEIYDTPAVIVYQTGLIEQETLLIDPDLLAELAAQLQLGIATGRPCAEAEYSLQRLGIRQYFDAVVCHEDAVAAGAAGKPDPWSLLEAIRRLQPSPARSGYIGDTPDDIRAAKAANQTVPCLAIGSLAVSQDKETLSKHFEDNRADIIIAHPNRLRDIIFR